MFSAFFIVIGHSILYLQHLPLILLTYSCLRNLCFFAACFLALKHKIWPKAFHLLMILYLMVLVYSTIVHNASETLKTMFAIAVDVATIVIMFAYGMKKNPTKTLKILSIVFSIYIYLNFLLLLLYPSGIWYEYTDTSVGVASRYFLGSNYNQLGSSLLLAMVLSAVYYQLTHKGLINLVGLIIVSFLSLIIVGSKTSLVCILLFYIFLLLKSSKLRSLAIRYFIIVYFFVQFLFVFTLTDLSANPLIKYVVEDLLGKDMSFSSRTDIWRRTAFMIVQSPVTGYGVQEETWCLDYIGGIMPHNYIYFLLLHGGFILLVVFIALFCVALHQPYKYKSKASQIVLFGCWIFFFMMIMEVYSRQIIFLFLTLMYYSKYYIKEYR